MLASGRQRKEHYDVNRYAKIFRPGRGRRRHTRCPGGCEPSQRRIQDHQCPGECKRYHRRRTHSCKRCSSFNRREGSPPPCYRLFPSLNRSAVKRDRRSISQPGPFIGTARRMCGRTAPFPSTTMPPMVSAMAAQIRRSVAGIFSPVEAPRPPSRRRPPVHPSAFNASAQSTAPHPSGRESGSPAHTRSSRA